MLAGIVRRTADIGGILEKSTADMADIGRRVSGIRAEYGAECIGAQRVSTSAARGFDRYRDGHVLGKIVEIDDANRKLLQEMRADTSGFPTGRPRPDRLADITAIERALKRPDRIWCIWRDRLICR